MAGGIFSGFICGAVLSGIGLVAVSELTPLPFGPGPAVPTDTPAIGATPEGGTAPALPVPQPAP
ncbi:hypothetical protein [Falsirhodobacter sp. 20TX0035]|uniref:hypothetical protein n=1 Tax=Falsirhodobacter sp. 20TX0035 TaxID=3022019 RepID=UPI00233110A4|nr:hypothetical protein [Falsirhodobacter sp. 20TX0035]MDB6454440.1 hypothetical protein [Falsirhodobacter sp. 20TX0035]